jgi:hypothetical protein
VEKKILQNYKLRWRPIWLVVGVMTSVFLVMAIVATFIRKHSAGDILTMVLMIAVIPAAIALFQKLGSAPGRTHSEWILRDEGLERIHSSLEREMILWTQIKRMFWNGLGGLIILYRKTPDPGEKPSRGLSRGMIFVERAEATEIAEYWRKHCPRDEAERARRTARRRQIGAGLMVLGVVVVCVLGPLVYGAYQSYCWPSVEGRIVSMQYEFNHSSKYPMGDVQISYEYTVDGSKYSSERFRPLSKGYRDKAATIESFVMEHKKGMPVKVYYNPKQPAEAVLLQGPEWGIWGSLLPEGPLLVLLGWMIRRKEARLEF